MKTEYSKIELKKKDEESAKQIKALQTFGDKMCDNNKKLQKKITKLEKH